MMFNRGKCERGRRRQKVPLSFRFPASRAKRLAGTPSDQRLQREGLGAAESRGRPRERLSGVLPAGHASIAGTAPAGHE